MRRFDPRFLEQLRGQKRYLVVGLICSVFVALFDLGLIPFIKWTIEAAAERNTVFLTQLAIGVTIWFALKYWFTFGKAYYLEKAAQRVTADLRKKLFAKMHELPVSYFNERQTGWLQSIVTNDVTLIQSGVSRIRDFVEAPITVVGALAALFWLNWKLALVSIVVVPPIALAIINNSRRVRRAQAQVQETLGDMSGMMQESLAATRVVKAFSAEERESTRFSKHVDATLRSNMAVIRRFALLKPLVELIGSVAIAAAVWLGGNLIARGEMGFEQLLAFIYALDRIRNGATGLGSLSGTYNQLLAATDRIYREVLDVQPEISDDRDAQILESPKGCIEFHNVSFTYPDGTAALRNINLKIEPGTSTALVGRSGAGKSTIADLILRFYDPTEGTITFDGVDIRSLRLSWYRRQIGVVPQQTLLFAATIAENITFGAPDATREDVVRAAQSAHADDFIASLQDGYDTLLGRHGLRLSGGEMQRISIARALITNPTLLILDEATSSLDAMSEKIVQSALDEIMSQRTTLVIAHRLTTAARADRIVVLSHGEIVEQGSHAELVAKDGAYAGLYRAFSRGVLEETLG